MRLKSQGQELFHTCGTNESQLLGIRISSHWAISPCRDDGDSTMMRYSNDICVLGGDGLGTCSSSGNPRHIGTMDV